MTRPTGIWKKTIVLTLAGGLAFWVTTIEISLLSILAEYSAAGSISNIQTVWVGGLIIGVVIACLVSYFLLRFFNKIPTKFNFKILGAKFCCFGHCFNSGRSFRKH